MQRLGLLVLVSASGLFLALALTGGRSFGHHLPNLFHVGAHGQMLLPTDGFSLSPGLHLGLQRRHWIKADAAVVLMSASCAPNRQQTVMRPQSFVNLCKPNKCSICRKLPNSASAGYCSAHTATRIHNVMSKGKRRHLLCQLPVVLPTAASVIHSTCHR